MFRYLSSLLNPPPVPARTRYKPVFLNYETDSSSEPVPSASPSSSRSQPRILICTWNIDGCSPHANLRLSALLLYLEQVVESALDEHPLGAVLCLQEVNRDTLSSLTNNVWVQRRFHVLNGDRAVWGTLRYSVVTLISRGLSIRAAFRVDFPKSLMGRCALFVDLSVAQSSDGHSQLLRVANAHLESLPMGLEARLDQLKAISAYLRLSAVHFGVVCGDMNSICPEDLEYSSLCGLRDAWLESDAFKVGDKGYTWGYQDPSPFPPGRLDKILLTQDVSIVRSMRVIGQGIKTEELEEDRVWATDHFGLLCTYDWGGT